MYICIYILFNYIVITALVNSGLLSHTRSVLFDEYEWVMMVQVKESECITYEELDKVYIISWMICMIGWVCQYD